MTVTAVRAATSAGVKPLSVKGAKYFSTIADFEHAVGKNGTVTLAPGASVKVHVGPLAMGGPRPSFEGFNQNSPFKVEWDGKSYILSAKADASGGATDSVKLNHGSAPTLHPAAPVKFPFKLQVAEAGVQVTAADNGKTIKVKLGQPVSVSLPANNAGEWNVLNANRSFGNPKVDFTKTSRLARFEWDTKGPFIQPGTYKVSLGYHPRNVPLSSGFTPVVHGGPGPGKKFTVTFEVVK